MRAKATLSTFVLVGLFLLSSNLHAQNWTVYSNTTNYTGFGFANGGSALVGANSISRLVADDIFFNPAIAPGLQINGFTFSVANFNASAVSARPRVRFYADNGGVPGTLLTGFTFAAVSFPVGVGLFGTSITPSAAFVVPAPGVPIWAGITFDNNSGATGATIAQLNGLGQGIFNPPTIGSSNDRFFSTTSAGDFLSSNPAGSLNSFGGNPIANFGWAFTTVAVPEPTTWALIGSLAVGGFVTVRRYRQQKVKAMEQKLKA